MKYVIKWAKSLLSYNWYIVTEALEHKHQQILISFNFLLSSVYRNEPQYFLIKILFCMNYYYLLTAKIRPKKFFFFFLVCLFFEIRNIYPDTFHYAGRWVIKIVLPGWFPETRIFLALFWTLINLYDFDKGCKILCIFNATSGVWLWPQLDWHNIYMSGFDKEVSKRNTNYCYLIFCFLPISLAVIAIL